jgi:hypothetical protein
MIEWFNLHRKNPWLWSIPTHSVWDPWMIRTQKKLSPNKDSIWKFSKLSPLTRLTSIRDPSKITPRLLAPIYTYPYLSEFKLIPIWIHTHPYWDWSPVILGLTTRCVNDRPFDRFGVSFRRKWNGTTKYFTSVLVTKRLNAIKIYSVPTTKRLTKFCCFVSFQLSFRLNSVHLLCTIVDKNIYSN